MRASCRPLRAWRKRWQFALLALQRSQLLAHRRSRGTQALCSFIGHSCPSWNGRTGEKEKEEKLCTQRCWKRKWNITCRVVEAAGNLLALCSKLGSKPRSNLQRCHKLRQCTLRRNAQKCRRRRRRLTSVPFRTVQSGKKHSAPLQRGNGHRGPIVRGRVRSRR